MTTGSFIGSTLGATRELNEPFHTPVGGRSVWFKFRATSSTRIALDTFGSDFDTVLAVYVDNTPHTPGTLGELSWVGTSDDIGTDGHQSRIVFSTVAGFDYYVAVDGRDAAGGVLVLNWRRAEMARVLWRHTSGAISIWTVNAAGALAAHATYGPFAGWSPVAIAVGPDRRTRVLWRHDNGMITIWTLNASGQIAAHQAWGPFDAWSASDLVIAPDGRIHLSWSHANGSSGVWLLSQDATALLSSVFYGPQPGWQSKSIALDYLSTRRTLWRADNNAAGLWWEPTPYGVPNKFRVFGPYHGWTPDQISAGTDDESARVLWRHSNGAAQLWRVALGDAVNIATYGPFVGWTAISLAVPGAQPSWDDHYPRLLWRHTGGAISIWKTGIVGESPVKYNYGPFAGWTAIDIAVGPE